MEAQASNQAPYLAALPLPNGLPFSASDVNSVAQITLTVFEQYPTLVAGIDPEEGFPYVRLIVRVPDDVEKASQESLEWHRRVAELGPSGVYGLDVAFA